MADDLAAWLLEQFDEADRRERPLGSWNFPFSRADREAKRQIIAEHAEDEGTGYCRRCEWDAGERDDPAKGDGSRFVAYPCTTLRWIGAPYVHHAGYRPEWSPS